MSQLPMRMLNELLGTHGRALADNPARCRELMLEVCPLYPREVAAIVAAAELGVVNDLLTADPDLNWGQLTAPMIRRMIVDGQLTEREALAAVEAWVQALGLTIADAPFVPLDSLAEVEERMRADQRERRIAGIRAGAGGGLGTGLVIGLVYAMCWLARTREASLRGAGQTFDLAVIEAVLGVGAAIVAGGAIGALIGGWLRHTLPTFGRILTGGMLGLIYGLGYHGLWAPLVQLHVDDIWALPIQLVLGSVVGLMGGGLVGLLVDWLTQTSADQGPPDEEGHGGAGQFFHYC